MTTTRKKERNGKKKKQDRKRICRKIDIFLQNKVRIISAHSPLMCGAHALLRTNSVFQR